MLRAIVLAVALLAAQQNALAHALWHAGGEHSQSQGHDEDEGRLCDLHAALGSVLGALGGKAQAPLACIAQARHFDERALPAPHRFRASSPLSRGPPARL